MTERTDVLLHFSQFALVRSNQGNGTAAGICGEIRLLLAFVPSELRSLHVPEGRLHPSWPRCSFLRQGTKASSAGQLESKFVCFWKHRKESREQIYVKCYFLMSFSKYQLFLIAVGRCISNPPPSAEGDFVGWYPGVVWEDGTQT